MTRHVSDAASNSHPVAAFISAAPISRLRRARLRRAGPFFSSAFFGQARSRSAHLDRPELIRPRKIERGGAGLQAAVVSAPSSTTPAVTYFQNAISSFRARATIRTFRTRPPLNWTRWWNHWVKMELG